MSFHGGLIGVILVMIIFAKRTKRFFQVADFIAPLIPFGLAPGVWATLSTVSCGAASTRASLHHAVPGLRAEDMALLPSTRSGNPFSIPTAFCRATSQLMSWRWKAWCCSSS
jgi:prolipoprotein diacylglyceryltransferase